MPYRAIAQLFPNPTQLPLRPAAASVPRTVAARPIDTHKILNGNHIAKGVLIATWAITLCVVIVSFAMAQAHFEAFDRIQSTVRMSTKCADASSALMVSLLDLETGQRGYVITGDSGYLEPYQKGLSSVWERYSTLKDTFEPLDSGPNVALWHDEQAKELEGLKEVIVAKVSELQRTIMARQSQGFEAAAAIVRSDTGKKLMEKIRFTLERIHAFIKTVLDRDQVESDRMVVVRRVTTITSLALIGASLMFGCLCYCLTDKRSERERLSELEVLLERAESATKLKSAFVSTVSHELRTPMTGLSSIVDLLQKTHLGSDQKELISIMNSSVQVMLRLINDILLFSKMESGRLGLVPQPTDLYRFLALVSDPFFAVASQKSIVFRTLISDDLPAGVLVDPDRLRQVVVNLCDNALKFTPRCGRVDFSVRRLNPLEEHMTVKADTSAPPGAELQTVYPLQSSNQTIKTAPSTVAGESGSSHGPAGPAPPTARAPAGAQVTAATASANGPIVTTVLRFAVIDNGIGIHKEAQDSIFQPFTQAEMTTGRRYGGTGLGLTISQQLVRLMGGELHVDSEPGHGSTFSFNIPVRVVPLPRNSPSNTPGDVKSPPVPGGPLQAAAAKSPRTPTPTVTVPSPAVNARHMMTPLTSVLEHSGTTTVTSKVKLSGSKVTDFETKVTRTPSQRPKIELTNISPAPTPAAAVVLAQPTPEPGAGAAQSASGRRLPTEPPPPYFTFPIVPLSKSPAPQPQPALALQSPQPLPHPPLLPPNRPPHALATLSAATFAAPPNAAANAPAHAAAKGTPSGMSVLVVEDSVIVQKVMAKMLAQLGHKYTIVSNGREALDLILAHKTTFDAVLMDVHMPVMDGLTATRLIREYEGQTGQPLLTVAKVSGRLPVLALTAGASEDEQQECLRAQMDGVITKPVSLRELDATLRRLPRRHTVLRTHTGAAAAAAAADL